MSNEQSVFAPINPATGEAVKLALQELTLSGTVLPVGATLQVRHIFKSAEENPIEVVYAFGLPRDATLRRFRIVGEGFSVESDLKPTKEAVECYERGIADGSLSTLARQYQDGIVNLSVGNIRPGETVAVFLEIMAGVELRDDGLRLRFPFTLAPGYHGEARMVESAPGQGELELPESFDDLILPTWMKDASNLHRIGFDLNVSFPQGVAEIGSPSHAIKVANGSEGHHRVSLAPASEVPNRDLVLDVRTERKKPEVIGGIRTDSRGHFALVVPSTLFGEAPTGPRRVVFLLDRSGSMEGLAINQAKQALEACLGTLSEEDQFGLVAFDNEVVSMLGNLQNADSQGRQDARDFLRKVEARGGTELVSGFQVAARMLKGEGGDILLITDGQVFGSDEILKQARATGVRLHCLGIGSASQDRFLSLLARETGGISRFVTPRERVDLAAIELFAGIGRPVATEVRIDHPSTLSLSPKLPTLIRAGEPLLLFGELEGHTEAEISITWDGEGKPGVLNIPFSLETCPEAESVFLLHGSRLITDAETKTDSDTSSGTLARRQADRESRLLENLSRKYGLASRAMSLVAVVKRADDKADTLPETKVIPVGMPQDTAFGSYFDHGVVCDAMAVPAMRICSSPSPRISNRIAHRRAFSEDVECSEGFSAPNKIRRDLSRYAEEADEDLTTEDLAVVLAAKMEPDGGMPGDNEEQRWIASAIAVFLFMEQGSTESSGTFWLHVRRLRKFISSAGSTIPDARFTALIERIQNGDVPSGDWRSLAVTIMESGHVSVEEFWLEASK